MKLIKQGFTLIELLVVITIIGILIGVGTASYQRAVKLSRDSKRKTDIEQIRQAVETYRSEVGTYPANQAALVSGGYVNSLPTDPTPPNRYSYVVGNPPTTYAICSALEIVPTSPVVPNCSGVWCSANADCNYEVDNP